MFDKSSDVVGYYIAASTGVWTQTGSTSRSILVKCEPDTTYTIFVPTNRTLRAVYFNNYPSVGDEGYEYTDRTTADYINKTLTITTGSSAQYLAFFCYNSAQESTMYDEAEYFSQVMLNTGSTALPYEPYGYKITISSAGQTTPVYLGEVETTRKIYKYEFKGSETWSIGSENYYSFVPQIYGDGVPFSAIICSHCSNATINNTGLAVFFKKTDFPDITTGAELKQFCAAQYAAGTPVTVWYVLAEPETGIVNEPLMKIGDYADEVSGISIPTIAGGDTLSVDTTLQPSEVTVNYKGWHSVADVHERDNGAWT